MGGKVLQPFLPFLKSMRTLIISLFLLPLLEGGVIDPTFIEENLTHKAYWGHLHAAHGEDLGAGMLYYGLVYAAKAKVCVCLGSGDGFVPRVLRQAQRDLNIADSKTVLVDGNLGKWGRPLWLNKESFFRQQYPEIEIILDTTARVSKAQAKEWKIDYLHIDADRSTMGALQDFLDYLPYMSENGIIILHDTGAGRPCSNTVSMIKKMGYSVVNLEFLGTGAAIIYLK